MSGPTLTGYTAFLRDVVGIDTTVLPSGSPVIEFSYNLGINYTQPLLAIIPQLPEEFLYTTAVYNFATHMLMVWAKDQPNQEFFKKIQKQYNLHSLVAGAVESAQDETTSSKLKVPKFFDGLTFSQLDLMKTPWGRMYLEIAQSVGSLSLLNMA